MDPKLAPLSGLPSQRHGLSRMTAPRFAVTGNNHTSLQIDETIQRLERLVMVVVELPPNHLRTTTFRVPKVDCGQGVT